MTRFDDLHLFITIVQAGSFTKAGEQLGVSKSALSQSIANLENRLNIRLLNRTTRSVSPTPEGLTLYNDIAAHFSAIGEGLAKLTENQENIAGTVRINASEMAIETVILPKLAALLTVHPLISLELHGDNNFVDIVSAGFDMGVRLGGAVADGMVAVKISPPLTMAIVATPQYLHGKNLPKTIAELDNHRLINVRFAPDRPPIAWDFLVNGEQVEYTPKAQIIANTNPLQAARNHLGIAFVGLKQVEQDLQSGKLVELLGGYRMTYEPFYAYYPSRKHHSRAFELVLEALRSNYFNNLSIN
ncbi:LysR family transcriptional regulator [Neisseria sp. CCUG17229]|uniref:LysR family transcriptional regulator n=1 Tax=Neisseria sp. CCUG17229 TaxID=3392036 RepID=UPI003A0FC33B